jgi:hypothetical protein
MLVPDEEPPPDGVLGLLELFDELLQAAKATLTSNAEVPMAASLRTDLCDDMSCCLSVGC